MLSMPSPLSRTAPSRREHQSGQDARPPARPDAVTQQDHADQRRHEGLGHDQRCGGGRHGGAVEGHGVQPEADQPVDPDREPGGDADRVGRRLGTSHGHRRAGVAEPCQGRDHRAGPVHPDAGGEQQQRDAHPQGDREPHRREQLARLTGRHREQHETDRDQAHGRPVRRAQVLVEDDRGHRGDGQGHRHRGLREVQRQRPDRHHVQHEAQQVGDHHPEGPRVSHGHPHEVDQPVRALRLPSYGVGLRHGGDAEERGGRQAGDQAPGEARAHR